MANHEPSASSDPMSVYYLKAIEFAKDGYLSVEDKLSLAVLAKELQISDADREDMNQRAIDSANFIDNPHSEIIEVPSSTEIDPFESEIYVTIDEQIRALQNKYEEFDSKKDYHACIDVLNQLIDLQPHDPVNYMLLGNDLLQVGDFQRALDMYKIAEAYAEPDHQLFYLIYNAYVKLLDYQNAEVYIVKAIELEPFNTVYLQQLMQTQYDLFKLKEAIDTADGLLKSNPTDSFALLIKGISLSELGETENAIVCLTESDRIRPNLVPTHLELAKAYSVLKQYDKELELLLKAKTLDPNSGYVLYLIGRCYFAQGKIDDSMEYLTESLKYDTKNPHTFLYIGLILVTIADDLHESGRQDEANENANLAFDNIMYATNINGLSEQNFQFADRVLNDLAGKYDIKIMTEGDSGSEKPTSDR